ncbi:MAG: bifunctional folylpolyglutamate synthase/dihydrofolate synthase [Proteobacteria bacterium]|nr:bifunctional folylpolyglutamate synthase/dihydrofolate synthase [Pseudomonadota bacterium]
MFAFGRFGIVLGLETICAILEKLGNPHNSFKSIHIAGTNGKGSVASALSSILAASGYRVGLYTSPHLIHFNERICIDNQPISNDEVVDAYIAVDKWNNGKRKATFFELATAMAFYEFARKNVEWAVIETGMGGRLDATNIITPEISVITNISIEHKMYLGNTISKIAGEKGGIIKKGRPVVTGVRQRDAIQTLDTISENKHAPIFRLGKDFKTRKNRNHTFTYFGMNETLKNMETGLLGNYQIDNAGLTIAVCELLNQSGTLLPSEKIREGLKKNCWPGRLETISDAPLVFVDGAHNLSAIRNLKRFLSENTDSEKLTLIIGILDDKPYVQMLNILLPACNRVIITKPDSERSTEPEILFNTAKTISENVTIKNSVKEALEYALETTRPDEAICIAGSLYLVGEAKAIMAGISKKRCSF